MSTAKQFFDSTSPAPNGTTAARSEQHSKAMSSLQNAMVTRWPFRRRLQFALQNIRSAFPLWISDVCSLAAIMALSAICLRVLGVASELNAVLPLIVAQSLIVTFAFGLLRLYPGVGLHPVVELRQSAYGLLLGFGCSIVGLLLSERSTNHALLLLLISAPFSLALVPTLRQFARQVLAKTSWWCQPVMVFAGPNNAQNLWYHLARQPELGWRPVSLIASSVETEGIADVDVPDTTEVRSYDDVVRIALSRNVFCGILDQDAGCNPEVLESLHTVLPRLVTVVSQSETPALWVEGTECAGLPCICYHRALEHPLQRVAKRLFDIMISATLLMSLMPIFLTAAIALRLTSPGPIFFFHFRTGRFGKQFRIWKFRSMVVNSDELLQKYLAEHPELREEWRTSIKLENDPRITSVGRILRKTSIDELPQLWNVLNGSMSLVGPRPILNEEVEKYGSTYPLYAQVRPGMTGLWQVSGRNNTSYEKRLHYVSYYVRNWSLWLDWYIVLKTFRVVVSADGAS